jgi:hypothetical protein
MPVRKICAVLTKRSKLRKNFALAGRHHYSHVIPYAVSLGERHFHATMGYNPSQGEIAIRFFDANEKPYRTFNAARARVVLIVDQS